VPPILEDAQEDQYLGLRPPKKKPVGQLENPVEYPLVNVYIAIEHGPLK